MTEIHAEDTSKASWHHFGPGNMDVPVQVESDPENSLATYQGAVLAE